MARTIYALSSGKLPSGVAVIRLSGPDSLFVAERLSGLSLIPRKATLARLKEPKTNILLDEAIVLYFPAPASFTGEDVVELQCHGGMATIAKLLNVLSEQEGLKQADAGEFSRRAFENGRMDLTALEGLSDLLAAQTESQRQLALAQADGNLRELYDRWRKTLIQCRAFIEAELDFSDEEDVPDDAGLESFSKIELLKKEIEAHLDDKNKGEIIKDGFKIVLLGPPNVGKSSLLNALAQRDVAIVTPEAGTTRDVLSVSLDIEDMLVHIFDTAGLRQTENLIEQEGIKRAEEIAKTADLLLWLQPLDESDQQKNLENESLKPDQAITLYTKSDLSEKNHDPSLCVINTVNPQGLDPLVTLIKKTLKTYGSFKEENFITRQRYRTELKKLLGNLNNFSTLEGDIELRSEELRCASDCLGKITGKIDVEDLLDVIFSEFCVGK